MSNCIYCNEFLTSCNVKRHQKTSKCVQKQIELGVNLNIKTFKCKYCNKSFTRSDVVKKHEKVCKSKKENNEEINEEKEEEINQSNIDIQLCDTKNKINELKELLKILKSNSSKSIAQLKEDERYNILKDKYDKKNLSLEQQAEKDFKLQIEKRFLIIESKLENMDIIIKPIKTPLCKIKNCISVAKSNSLCFDHGGGKRCTYFECDNLSRSKLDFCLEHGGFIECKIKNCYNNALEGKDVCNHHSDINEQIKRRIMSRFNSVCKLNIKLEDLIGCDIEEFLTNIENKFTKGMDWTMYGYWELDHIKACKTFNMEEEEEAKKCFHYKNYQPLWKSDNCAKGKKEIYITSTGRMVHEIIDKEKEEMMVKLKFQKVGREIINYDKSQMQQLSL